MLVCGSYIRVGNWFRQATFRRVVVLYNVVDPIGFSTLLQQVCIAGKPKVELLFASDWMKSVTGLPGSFDPSPIDTDLFAPGVRSADESGAFVVGRLSRDDPVKFHPAAAGFFGTLASQGVPGQAVPSAFRWSRTRTAAMRKSMGANARQTIVELCGRSGFARFARFYLQ